MRVPALAVLVPFLAMAAETETKAESPATLYVAASVLRIRAEPSPGAEVLATLRIGAEVRVRGRRGDWVRLATFTDGIAAPGAAQPVEGWAPQGLLSASPPTLEEARAGAREAGTARERRPWVERAAALAPSDEAVIELLITTLEAAGDGRAEAAARKGLVAAQKRNRSWDGPLYPIRDGVAAISRACVEGDPPPARAGAARLSTPALRARAFEIVDSGKVVSVTTGGGRTERLNRRACRAGPCGPQLAYVLPRHREGALVPSWLVAGHPIVGYRPAARRPTWLGEAAFDCGEGCAAFLDAGDRTVIQLRPAGDGAAWRLVERTFDGHRAHPWKDVAGRYLRARPIARFDEREGELKLLWRTDAEGVECREEAQAWLVRLVFGEGRTLESIEEGAGHAG